jgi:hypothetical protein
VDRSKTTDDDLKPGQTHRDTNTGDGSPSIVSPQHATGRDDRSACRNTPPSTSLDILAEAATAIGPIEPNRWIETTPSCRPGKSMEPTVNKISPVIEEALVLPRAAAKKLPPRQLVSSLPDNLTSPECIRQMSLKQLEKVRAFADRENKAKHKYFA